MKFRNHAQCGRGKIGSCRKHAIFGHVWARKRASVRSHVPCDREKKGSFSKDATYGHIWLGKREEFPAPRTQLLAKQGGPANISYMGGKSTVVSEVTPFTVTSLNILYGHTWTQKGRCKVALSLLDGARLADQYPQGQVRYSFSKYALYKRERVQIRRITE